MRFRKLGKTGIRVSEIGLGTEYLEDNKPEVVRNVIHESMEKGINYMDLVYAFPEYRDNIGSALKGHRDRWVLAGHIGCGDEGGQYKKIRDAKECESTFNDLLKRLHTDHVDVILLQFVSGSDYKQVMGGMLGLAKRMVKEEKAKHIGISGHSLPVMLKAVESGEVDVVMFPRNLITGRQRDAALLDACEKTGTGFVAMKPFAGGRALKKKVVSPLTPAQCLGYVLSDPRVSTTVPGFSNVKELREGLKLMDMIEYPEARPEDITGVCMYCNHCLPCPAGINIGKVNRLLDVGLKEMDADLKKKYDELPSKASQCVECGECTERCPFDVNPMERMKKAKEIFES